MSRQFFDISEDEQLSIEIRKYPCIFDKSNVGYKEKDRVENAWKEIDYFMILITDSTLIFQFPKFTSG